MKKLIAALLVLPLVAAMTAASAAAEPVADQGRISSAVLAEIGLGGMDVLSDEQGLSIRGKGKSFSRKGTTIIAIQVAKVHDLSVGSIKGDAIIAVNIKQNMIIR